MYLRSLRADKGLATTSTWPLSAMVFRPFDGYLLNPEASTEHLEDRVRENMEALSQS
jgi:hypothetical protein